MKDNIANFNRECRRVQSRFLPGCTLAICRFLRLMWLLSTRPLTSLFSCKEVESVTTVIGRMYAVWIKAPQWCAWWEQTNLEKSTLLLLKVVTQCPLSFAHRQSLSGSIPLPPISLSKSMLSQSCSLRASWEVGEDRWVSCLTARVTTEACCADWVWLAVAAWWMERLLLHFAAGQRLFLQEAHEPAKYRRHCHHAGLCYCQC